MDAAEYKHVVLGLIFLKYISDAFGERYNFLLEEFADPQSQYYVKEETSRFEFAEDRDEYLAENVFYVPKEARWSYLQANAKQPQIGTLIDNAMLAIEQENPRLKGVLPKNYARPMLDKQRLGELVDLIGTVGLGGMFVQSEAFVELHGGRRDDISIYGQESNPTTRQLALMNLAIRGIDANLGMEHADSFHHDLHPDLKADYILANPPFNSSDWGGERLREDGRWVYGVPPPGNANFAWVQHFIYHIARTKWGWMY
ncbi:Putative type I restriction enzyme MjaXP M protein [Geodia barretti]|uniref:site-specific DNA-methyltransferase (adenine-specific) n=1 Tax=Geodia barretti TaxID=519541 RepID=A0AA35ST90_GEOBA|nr:Putative type I restriction enzyme MjaXP M protein [Geodia barretti]